MLEVKEILRQWLGAALTDGLVAAVLTATQPATGRPRGDGWATCEARRSFIEKHIDHGVRLTKVRKLLGREGVEVGYQTLRRFALKQLGFGHSAVRAGRRRRAGRGAAGEAGQQGHDQGQGGGRRAGMLHAGSG